MSLTDLEQHVLAYYAATAAPSFTMAGRFYPYGELVLIVEDKVQVATRKFGAKVTARAKPAATAFLDLMIEKGAFSTQQNKFGGTMHQFQGDIFRQAVADFVASDPVIQKAEAQGPEFWEQAFASLTNS